jgi:hypothetical protein
LECGEHRRFGWLCFGFVLCPGLKKPKAAMLAALQTALPRAKAADDEYGRPQMNGLGKKARGVPEKPARTLGFVQ